MMSYDVKQVCHQRAGGINLVINLPDCLRVQNIGHFVLSWSQNLADVYM